VVIGERSMGGKQVDYRGGKTKMFANNQQVNLQLGAELWLSTQEMLRHEHGDSTYRSWFSQISFGEVKDNTLILTAPSRFIKEWVDYNYLQAIAQTVATINNSISKIEIKIKPTRALFTEVSKVAQVGFKNDDILVDEKCDLMDYDLDKRFSFDNFIVGQSNRLAFNAAKSVATGGKLPVENNILYIQSPVGMGKTHLLQAIAMELRANSELKVAYLSADKFMHLYIGAIRRNSLIELQTKMLALDVLLIDDLQFICGKNATQQELGRIFSQLTESNKKVVVSCDTTPYNLNLDPRTKSRLAGGLCVKVMPTDYDLRFEILLHKSKSLDVPISEDVLKYLAQISVKEKVD